MDVTAYQDQLIQLLPPGRAWPRDPQSTFGRLLGGLAVELARVDGRITDLGEEAYPRTTLELLPDWERVAGLPDDCSGAPDGPTERRVALVNRLAARGGQSPAYFVELAARLGYVIDIAEYGSFDAGTAAGAELAGDAWRFAWRADVQVAAAQLTQGAAEFDAGSAAGDRLLGFGALDLECVLGRAKPAHTDLIVSYTIEPEPLFWFDFTSED